jgi:predicted dehydrogenase
MSLSGRPNPHHAPADPEPPRRPLRAAVIGLGFIGPFHVDAVRRGGYGEVVSLVGTDQARTEARARSLGIAQATTDLATVLADERIDVVHVCTPNASHVPIANAVLDAGKALVLEKPIATDLESARALARKADQLGLHAMVALTYRGYPMVAQARARVARGELGALRLVQGAYLQDWLADETATNWRVERTLSGPSRAVGDIGTHWLDLAEFVSGERVDAVIADMPTFITERNGRPVDTEDGATFLVRFGNGARGSCLISQISRGHKNSLWLELTGSQAALRWEQEAAERLWLGHSGSTEVVEREQDPAQLVGAPSPPAGHSEGWPAALRDLLRPFYRAVAEGLPSPALGSDPGYPTLFDGARSIALVEAVIASARDQRWTAVEPVEVS